MNVEQQMRVAASIASLPIIDPDICNLELNRQLKIRKRHGLLRRKWIFITDLRPLSHRKVARNLRHVNIPGNGFAKNDARLTDN